MPSVAQWSNACGSDGRLLGAGVENNDWHAIHVACCMMHAGECICMLVMRVARPMPFVAYRCSGRVLWIDDVGGWLLDSGPGYRE